MSTLVYGSLSLSNGQSPHLCIEIPLLKCHSENGSILICQTTIIGKNILVEFIEGFHQEEVVVDEIFRTTRHIIDTLVLSQVAIEGIGLMYTLEFCKTDTGKVIPLVPDCISQIEDVRFEYQELFKLLGSKPQIRYAIRDFNQGLIDRENCPFLFRRAIETLAKFFRNNENNEKKLTGEDWNKFCNQIGVHPEKATDLKEITEQIMHPHRHGDHVFFTQEQHAKMLEIVRLFLSMSLKFLLESET